MKRTIYFLIIVLLHITISCSKEESGASKKGSISGVIKDKDTNLPIADVIVSTDPIGEIVSTDENGKYTISGLDEGIYTLSASIWGYAGGSVENITVVNGEDIKANLSLIKIDETKGVISGKIIKFHTTTGIPGVVVTTIPATSTAITDADGNYTIYNVDATQESTWDDVNGTYSTVRLKESYSIQIKKDNYVAWNNLYLKPSVDVHPGETLENISYCMLEQNTTLKPIPMVKIEGATITLGNAGVSGNPPHSVTLNSFYIGKYEITEQEFGAVMRFNPSLSDNWEGNVNYPVNPLSFYDVLIFCNKLSKMEGKTPCYTINGFTDPDKWGFHNSPGSSGAWDSVQCNWSANGYRLPTDAEWEYAAGGATHQMYPGTNTESELGNYAWYKANSDQKLYSVGQKLPNSFGLYDMGGNVGEFCWNIWESLTTNALTNPRGPIYPRPGNYRNNILRGGNWFRESFSCKTDYRNTYLSSGAWADKTGVRLVRNE
jgi:formylglycine-generating enzyme required for sulfatase activity